MMMMMMMIMIMIMIIIARADNGSMGHGSMGQMGQIFWMGQWVMGKAFDPLTH